MTFLDWLGGTLLALLLAIVLGGIGHRRARGQARADAILLLAAAVLVALVVILVLVLAGVPR